MADAGNDADPHDEPEPQAEAPHASGNDNTNAEPVTGCVGQARETCIADNTITEAQSQLLPSQEQCPQEKRSCSICILVCNRLLSLMTLMRV